MKNYTDIEQSERLAEFLPLESADMHYNNGSCRGVDYTEHFSAELMSYQEALHLMKIHKTNFMFQVIPCWSLAALLEVLPEGIIENYYVPNLQKENGKYSIAYGNDELLCMSEEPIDACYELIIKLHELNLL